MAISNAFKFANNILTNGGYDAADLVGAVGGGKVLQVVKTVADASTSTSSLSFQSTSTSASITPSSASSKILIISSGALFWASTADSGGVATIYRGSTNLAPSEYLIRNYPINTGGTVQREGTIIFLDSPSTTSSTTYNVRIKMVWGSGNIQWGSEGNEGQGNFILMEIGA
jgi:hypothetical protein